MKTRALPRLRSLFTLVALAVLSMAMNCQPHKTTSGQTEIAEAPPQPSSSGPNGDFKVPEGDVHKKTLGDLEFSEGTLDLVPNSIGAAGEIRYRIYSNGIITYEGYVTYFGQFEVILGGPASSSQDFRGAIQARPESVRSDTYYRVDLESTDYLLHTKVVKRADTRAEVAIAGLSYGATGKVTIDVSQPIVAIEHTSVTGKLWGVALTIELVARAK